MVAGRLYLVPGLEAAPGPAVADQLSLLAKTFMEGALAHKLLSETATL